MVLARTARVSAVSGRADVAASTAPCSARRGRASISMAT